MRLDTRGEMFPEGKNLIFKVATIPGLADDGVSWKWDFETVIDSEKKIYKERFWPGFLPLLLRVLKVPETTPGVFDFDPPKVLDSFFKADIVHQEQKKGKNAGKKFPRMVNIAALADDEIPF
jgi:hypothetical protein